MMASRSLPSWTRLARHHAGLAIWKERAWVKLDDLNVASDLDYAGLEPVR